MQQFWCTFWSSLGLFFLPHSGFASLGLHAPPSPCHQMLACADYPSRKFRLRTWDSGGCVGVGGDEATIHRKRGRAGDGREKEIKVPDINSTCLLGFSRSRSFEGHTTTALIAKVSRTKGLWGKVTMHFIPQGFISIIQLKRKITCLEPLNTILWKRDLSSKCCGLWN